MHIGTVKTGSTALQGFLSNASELLERKGFRHSKKVSNLSRDAWQGKDGAVAGEARRRVAELLERGDAIVSYEGFSGKPFHGRMPTRESVESLRGIVGEDIPVKVVLYLRRQDRLIESSYNNHVKRRMGTESFAEFAEKADLKRLDWETAVVAPFAECFGRGNMIVRQYESAVASGGIVADFFRGALGVDDEKWLRDASRLGGKTYSNRSLSPAFLKFLREANAERPKEELLELRRVMELIDDNRGGSAYFAADERRRVLGFFKKPNDALIAEWFPDAERFWKLSPEDAETERVDIDAPLEEDEKSEISKRLDRVLRMKRLAGRLPKAVRSVAAALGLGRKHG